MNILRRVAAAALLGTMLGGPASAEIKGDVVIGVLNDETSLFADLHGPGSVVAAQMAIDDFGGKVNGHPIRLLVGDHQNKPDIASQIARKWFDEEGVNMIVDVDNSAVALAVSTIAREKDGVLLDTGANTNRLTGDACSPNTIHFTLDNWADIHGTIDAMAGHGADTWFFLSVDSETGYDMERQAKPMLEKTGAKMIGSVRYPLNTPDFSSYLLQAQASKAKVVAIAGGGQDVANIVKQAREFGLQQNGQQMAALAAYITDVRGIGLPVAQGMIMTDAFYWDLNPQTRAFAKRFAERFRGRMPTSYHAGVYAAVLHYLKAAAALNEVKDGNAVVAQMKAMPTDDPLFGHGEIRVDGRAIHPMYVLKVKSPAESKNEWDVYDLIETIPADQAFKPLDPACPLVKHS
jgi:branched-chain amino acid transport system substrate-binding protein